MTNANDSYRTARSLTYMNPPNHFYSSKHLFREMQTNDNNSYEKYCTIIRPSLLIHIMGTLMFSKVGLVLAILAFLLGPMPALAMDLELLEKLAAASTIDLDKIDTVPKVLAYLLHSKSGKFKHTSRLLIPACFISLQFSAAAHTDYLLLHSYNTYTHFKTPVELIHQLNLCPLSSPDLSGVPPETALCGLLALVQTILGNLQCSVRHINPRCPFFVHFTQWWYPTPVCSFPLPFHSLTPLCP